MTERQQRFLLENLPATEEDRRRVDKFKHLREDFRKLLQKPITCDDDDVLRSFSGNLVGRKYFEGEKGIIDYEMRLVPQISWTCSPTPPII